MRVVLAVIASALVIGVAGCGDRGGQPGSRPPPWHVLRDPINPAQLTDMPFGTVSLWLQPWRSSLTTRPASTLRDAIGIDFNVTPAEAPATARLLHDSGVHRARMEIGWGAMSYTDPSRPADPAGLTATIRALRENHLRPLILLNSNSGGPAPARISQVNVSAPAAPGATTIALAASSVAQVVPGLSGFSETSPEQEAPGDLITSVSASGVATLSRPLPAGIAAGPATLYTLRYPPFAPPRLRDGWANPRFERSLAGWLAYARGIVSFVSRVYGSSNFDVEVWNELTFGSSFLDERNYFSPVPDPGANGDVTAALFARTLRMLHRRFPAVQVGDGFANTVPWLSGATVPPGTDAIDKHPYGGTRVFPGSTPPPGIVSLDARGKPQGGAAPGQGPFTPSFRVFMPEYYLTGLQTETLMRDLSPITTRLYVVPHGARTHPPGARPPRIWITETNMDLGQAVANGLPAADLPEFQAKAALRFLVAYASEGAQAIDLYSAAGGGCCQLIPPSFFSAVDGNPASYPARLGGLPLLAVGRLAAGIKGAETVTHPRQLRLDAVWQQGDAAQFTGNGTAATPSLYDRDMLAFFPFQVSSSRFAVAVYVMSSDLTHRYTTRPAAGATPYDMPALPVRLRITGVRGTDTAVSLNDPLTGAQVPARVLSRSGDAITVQLRATDSPRVLMLDENRAPASAPGLIIVVAVAVAAAVLIAGRARRPRTPTAHDGSPEASEVGSPGRDA